jgi:hypothetical protein
MTSTTVLEVQKEQQEQEIAIPAECITIPAETPLVELSAPPYYKKVCPSSIDFLAPVKEPRGKKVYVSNIAHGPLTVRTPPVSFLEAVPDGVGANEAFVGVAVPVSFGAWLKRVEDRILEQCIQNRAEWFKGSRAKDDGATLTADFKSFFEDTGAFKLKIPADTKWYDASGTPIGPEEIDPGCHLRCTWVLRRICFGARQFGAIWALEQARVAEIPVCVLPATTDDSDNGSDADEDAGGGDEAYADLADFRQFE